MTENSACNLVVMLGGPSAERAVSLRSGAAVVRALRGRGHQVTELDPVQPDWTLPAGTDVVFLALHGTYGEDGTVQAHLEELGVPYTGCNAEVSRIAFDKERTKERCRAMGVPVARGFLVEAASVPLPEDWTLPVVVKPVRQGSSVGLQFVDSADQWEPALTAALKFDNAVLVEERIVGRETTVAIVDGVALPIVEVRPKTGGYDYRNKYTAGLTEYLCPAPFEEAVAQGIQSVALAALNAIGGGPYARVDIMVRESGEPVVLEVNTLPGMTETSLFPKAAAAAGLSFDELCERLVELALRTPVAPASAA